MAWQLAGNPGSTFFHHDLIFPWLRPHSEENSWLSRIGGTTSRPALLRLRRKRTDDELGPCLLLYGWRLVASRMPTQQPQEDVRVGRFRKVVGKSCSQGQLPVFRPGISGDGDELDRIETFVGPQGLGHLISA